MAGDEEYEKELSQRLSNAIEGATSKAKAAIADAKMDYALKSALELKEDLDKNKKIDELVKKFESAKNEIEKKNIAE